MVISNPIYLGFDVDFRGTENLILVPENRANPDSRLITVHFLKFEAKEKSNLPPVFYFRGGPGESTEPTDFYPYYTRSERAKAFAFEVTTINQKRDVILVSQRAASMSRGLPLYQFKYRYFLGDKSTPHDFEKQGERQRRVLADTLRMYKQLGVDAAGYDFINLVQDIEDIRQYYGYDKIAMIGNSFGSQTALGYLKLYPTQVDRMLLSAIEPLSHTYDNPEGVWTILEKIETLAMADETIKNDLPEVGLLNALKAIVERLEKSPIDVTLDFPNEPSETVAIGIDDFRYSVLYPFANGRRNALETFPKYITEMYNGDFSALAFAALHGRDGDETDEIMPIQINNSLGISQLREQEINESDAARWLGDINRTFTQTRDATTSKVVDDAFRTQEQTDIPMVLIHGDLDKNTPLGNAHYLMDFLENGHLVTVKNGTHGTKWNLFLENESVGKQILEFMNVDFEKTSFSDFKKNLPDSYEFESLDFTPIRGKTLFEMELED